MGFQHSCHDWFCCLVWWLKDIHNSSFLLICYWLSIWDLSPWYFYSFSNLFFPVLFYLSAISHLPLVPIWKFIKPVSCNSISCKAEHIFVRLVNFLVFNRKLIFRWKKNFCVLFLYFFVVEHSNWPLILVTQLSSFNL